MAAALAAGHPVALHDGRVLAQPAGRVEVGKQGELSLTILETPMSGTPIELRLSADTIVLPENRLGWDDVVDPEAGQPRIVARMVAPLAAGEYTVRGRITYVTCGPERCRPRTAHVIWAVEVVALGVQEPDPG